VFGCQTSRDVCKESGAHIECMVKAGVGLMVSLREHSVIHLYHLETLEYLQDINVASAVTLTLSGELQLLIHTESCQREIILEMGKIPHCSSSVLYGFYQILGFIRFGFFPATEKMKVRFGFGSLCRVFGAIHFGFVRVLE